MHTRKSCIIYRMITFNSTNLLVFLLNCVNENKKEYVRFENHTSFSSSGTFYNQSWSMRPITIIHTPLFKAVLGISDGPKSTSDDHKTEIILFVKHVYSTSAHDWGASWLKTILLFSSVSLKTTPVF